MGVGAARVRDLFQQAKQHAPCIIFIDELDAIGRQRGVHVGAVNDEREQTLNALLVEMDGFEANTGVIVLAATNRPEVLDRAFSVPVDLIARSSSTRRTSMVAKRFSRCTRAGKTLRRCRPSPSGRSDRRNVRRGPCQCPQ